MFLLFLLSFGSNARGRELSGEKGYVLAPCIFQLGGRIFNLTDLMYQAPYHSSNFQYSMGMCKNNARHCPNTFIHKSFLAHFQPKDNCASQIAFYPTGFEPKVQPLPEKYKDAYSGGFSLEFKNGDYCDAIGSETELRVNILCDHHKLYPESFQVKIPEDCKYEVNIKTKRACTGHKHYDKSKDPAFTSTTSTTTWRPYHKDLNHDSSTTQPSPDSPRDEDIIIPKWDKIPVPGRPGWYNIDRRSSSPPPYRHPITYGKDAWMSPYISDAENFLDNGYSVVTYMPPLSPYISDRTIYDTMDAMWPAVSNYVDNLIHKTPATDFHGSGGFGSWTTRRLLRSHFMRRCWFCELRQRWRMLFTFRTSREPSTGTHSWNLCKRTFCFYLSKWRCWYVQTGYAALFKKSFGSIFTRWDGKESLFVKCEYSKLWSCNGRIFATCSRFESGRKAANNASRLMFSWNSHLSRLRKK